MTPAQFLERWMSVSIQAAIVITTAWAACRLGQLGSRAQGRLWNCAHALLLLLALNAMLLPHLQPLPRWKLEVTETVTMAHAVLITGHGLLIVWLGGVAVSTALMLAGWISAARCLKRCRNVEPGSTAAGLARGEDIVQGRPVTLLTGAHVGGPCCWQFHQPYILLPPAVVAFQERELQFVLRHELAHLRLGHPLQLFLQRIVEILYWYHPFVWWSTGQAALAREFTCDESVAQSRSDVAAYLRTLLAVVEQSAAVSAPCRQTLAFGAERRVIVQRARRLVAIASQPAALADSRSRTSALLAALVLCGLATATAWLPVDFLASPRSKWTPWPAWSAAALSSVGLPVRDYEVYDRGSQLYELQELLDDDETDSSVK